MEYHHPIKGRNGEDFAQLTPGHVGSFRSSTPMEITGDDVAWFC
jgi:hypothetical protein